MYETKPWLRFYGKVAHTVDYPHATMYALLRRTALRLPDAPAWEFMGRIGSFRELLAEVDRCANAFAALGLKQGQRATVALPNTPHALVCFYALNKLGVVASMIHPLSAPPEIELYLKESDSSWAITLDAFYGKFRQVLAGTPAKRLLLCRIPDYLGPLKKLGFALTLGRKIARVPADDPAVVWWHDLMRRSDPAVGEAALDPDEMAVILFSGGTTGRPKGIMLSSMNFNCLALQTLAQHELHPGEAMLAILPMFHGFGLGVCVHTMMVGGGKSLLVPRFEAALVGKLMRQRRPEYMAGVPTLYDALTRNADFRKADLSRMCAAFSGGDRLPRGIKEGFDAVLRGCGARIELREGYGLTESVTVCMLTPEGQYRENSIGVPYPDMMAKVVRRETLQECAPGEDGEICVRGPTVMLGYLNDPEETAEVLRKHPDGEVWLHTGDIGCMDDDGFFYFKQRAKRVVKVSGISVYPTQIEDVLNSHPEVALSCAIGVPDPHKLQHIKAFVVLKDLSRASEALQQDIAEHCKRNLNTWSVPKEIEFRAELPKTLVGKVAYTQLEKESFSRVQAAG